MFLLFCLLNAEAAEIQVAMTYPGVVAVVDGVRQINPNAALYTDLTAGPHQVEVRNLRGRSLAKLDVDVAVDERVRLQYRDGTLSELGRGLMPSVPKGLPLENVEDLLEEPDLEEELSFPEEHAPAPETGPQEN